MRSRATYRRTRPVPIPPVCALCASNYHVETACKLFVKLMAEREAGVPRRAIEEIVSDATPKTRASDDELFVRRVQRFVRDIESWDEAADG